MLDSPLSRDKVSPDTIRMPKAPSRPPTNGHVLLVDDQEYVRVLLTDNLEFDRFTATCASTGKEALACAARFKPDLAIVDLSLPDITGWDVCRSLLERWPSLPIIVLSAQTSNQVRQRMQELSLRYFVAKPYDPIALSELVKQILKK